MMNQYEIDYKQGYDRANDEWLDKIKQAREEIENIGKDIYTDAAETKCEVLTILDRLIESEG